MFESGLWLIPIVLIILEFFPKTGWRTNGIALNLLIWAVRIVLAPLIVWIFIKKNFAARYKAISLEQALTTARLELLKSQLNTHFLFNTLNTINAYVELNQNEKANKMLVSLSSLLRFSLKENNRQLITVKKEIEILQLYIDIQIARFEGRLNFILHCETSLYDALIPSMILQPLAENAVNYAVEPFTDLGIIEVTLKQQNEKLLVDVSDNGKAAFNKINFNNGIGLTNTKKRLMQLYGDNYVLNISPVQENNGVRVSFKIPLQFNSHDAVKNSDSR